MGYALSYATVQIGSGSRTPTVTVADARLQVYDKEYVQRFTCWGQMPALCAAHGEAVAIARRLHVPSSRRSTCFVRTVSNKVVSPSVRGGSFFTALRPTPWLPEGAKADSRFRSFPDRYACFGTRISVGRRVKLRYYNGGQNSGFRF